MEFSEESNVLEDTFDDQLVNKKVNEEDRTFEESIQGVQEEPQIRGKHERSEGDEFTDYTSSSSIVDNNNISKKQRIEDSEALPKEDENGTGSNDDMHLLVSNEDGQGTLAEFSNDNQTRLDELHTTPLNNVMDLATNGESSQSENRDNNESKLAFDYEEVAFDGSESKLDENNNFNNGNNNSNNTNVKTEQPPLAIGEFSTSSGSMEISLSPAEDLAKRIRKQVDFYFSEANLRDDTFLKTEIRKNPEKWVDISCILTFNRMRVLTDSVSVVADAMRTSSVVKVSPDGLKLRRKIAMRANPPDPRLCRIHVAPLPPDTIIEDLEHVFGGLGAGEVRMTRIRKPTEEDLKIDPSPPKEAILEFETPEIAREVVAASVRQSVTLRGHTPQVEMLIDWLNRIRRGREEADRFSNYTNFQPGTLVTLEYIPRDTTKEDILYSCGPKAGIKLIDYVRGAEMGVVHFETPECAHNAVAKLIKDGIAGRKVQIACVMSRAGEEAYRADVEKRKEEVRLGSVFRGRGGPRGGMGRGGPRGRGGRGGFGRGGGRGGSGGRGGGRGGPRGGMGRGRGSGRGGPGRDSRGSAQSRSSMDRDDRSRQRSSSDGRNSGPRDDREQRGSGGFSDHREDRPRFDDRRDDRPRFDDRNDRKHPMHNREDDRDRKRQRHDEGNASGAPGNHRR